MKRLFVAVDLPDAIKAIAAQAKTILESRVSGVRWVEPNNVHLTLKFLGNCPDEQIDQIKNALDEAVAPLSSFACVSGGLGAFPSLRRARVLWLGIEAKPELAELSKAVEGSLEGLGFQAEKRAFSPHITLARLKSPRPVDLSVAESTINTKHGFAVGAVTLFASHLSPKGPTYEGLADVKLRGT